MDEEEEVTQETAVDRREETVITQLPGFAATEQVVRDVAAERRMRWYMFNRVLWTVLTLLEILLAFRVGLRLIGANPASGFAVLVYGFSGLFVAPFNGLVPTPTFGDSALEISTLIAMAVYGLIFLGIQYCFRLLVDRPGASTFVRTTRQQSQNGENVRTTHTTISNRKL